MALVCRAIATICRPSGTQKGERLSNAIAAPAAQPAQALAGLSSGLPHLERIWELGEHQALLGGRRGGQVQQAAQQRLHLGAPLALRPHLRQASMASKGACGVRGTADIVRRPGDIPQRQRGMHSSSELKRSRRAGARPLPTHPAQRFKFGVALAAAAGAARHHTEHLLGCHLLAAHCTEALLEHQLGGAVWAEGVAAAAAGRQHQAAR